MDDDIFQDFEMAGQTGFQSATNEYGEKRLSIDKYLNLASPSIYIFEAEGKFASKHFHIKPGDFIVIDRKLEVFHKCLVALVIGSDFFIGEYILDNGKAYLMPHKIQLNNTDDVEKKVWGVIKVIINMCARSKRDS